MRQSLHSLFNRAIALKYRLPAATAVGTLPKAVISTKSDDCWQQLLSNQDISSLIYNGVVEYAYNDTEVDLANLDNLQLRAFQNKIKYNPSAPLANKIGYGFHAEVLLHLILDYQYNARKCIARGYMYNPLEKSEIKGYDSYLMVEDSVGHISLFFGEAKAYINGFKKSVDEIFKEISKALSDEYLHANFLAMENQYYNIDPNCKIPQIIDEWRKNPKINIAVEAAKYNMELVYPMLIMYDNKGVTYEDRILKVVNYINNTYPTVSSSLTLPHSLFFIFLTVDDCREIKKKVVEWISLQQPVTP